MAKKKTAAKPPTPRARPQEKKPPKSLAKPQEKNSWQIAFFRRHREDDPKCSVQGRAFLESCPEGVRAKMIAVLRAVRDAPPPSFSGGGYWEKMHGEMAGYFEVRVDGPEREHFRLFCLLERDDEQRKLGASTLVIIAGLKKDFQTTFTKSEYAGVRRLGDEYMRRTPRSIEL